MRVLEILKQLAPTTSALQAAKQQAPRHHEKTNTQTTRKHQLINPMLDEIDELLDVYYAWQHHAQTHLHHEHHQEQPTSVYKQPTDNNTPVHRLIRNCGCFPERQQMMEELADYITRAQQLLDEAGKYLPYPCPHCDTIRYWNMAVTRVECKACGNTHNTNEGKSLAVARARSVLNVDKLRRKLKQRK